MHAPSPNNASLASVVTPEDRPKKSDADVEDLRFSPIIDEEGRGGCVKDPVPP